MCCLILLVINRCLNLIIFISLSVCFDVPCHDVKHPYVLCIRERHFRVRSNILNTEVIERVFALISDFFVLELLIITSLKNSPEYVRLVLRNHENKTCTK